VCHVSLPSSYRSRRGHIHLLRVLPLVGCRSKTPTVWKRVQGWMEQSLSSGGKEVLIKAVAQAIPTYSMACFRLPRGLCQHIDGLLRSFWWGSKEGKRRTCWVAWEMTKPKYLGGLGFRDIELFNLALLTRQAWRLLQEPTSLSARVLKAAYYLKGDFLSA
jgi:hypothetical protein